MRCQSLLAVVALAAPLAAQRPAKPDSTGHAMMGPGGPGMMPGMMMGGSMMREMGPAMTTMMLEGYRTHIAEARARWSDCFEFPDKARKIPCSQGILSARHRAAA